MKTFIDSLTTTIKDTLAEESQTGHFAHFIAESQHIGETFQLDNVTPDRMLAFVIDYVSCLPEYLDALKTTSEEVKATEFVEPLYKMIIAYLTSPPDFIVKLGGLHALLAKAYLAHRMIEEINDQIHQHAETQLLPLENSTTNLMAYSLLGLETSDPLDHLVLMAMETTETEKDCLYDEEVRKALLIIHRDNWQTHRQRWPAIDNTFSISLNL